MMLTSLGVAQATIADIRRRYRRAIQDVSALAARNQESSNSDSDSGSEVGVVRRYRDHEQDW
jgi:hypothetical protein